MPPESTVPSRHYFYSIDGLRLVAAVNIVLFHLQTNGGLNAMQGTPAWFFRIIKGPAFHASLFFILAGFIYTIKYAAHVHEFSTRAFITSRLKDLYPLHVITTCSMVPFIIMAGIRNHDLPLIKIIFSLFMHLSLLWSQFPFFSYSLNRPSWALSGFFFCYLLFRPALRFIVTLQKKRQIFAGMGICFSILFLWTCLFTITGAGDDLYPLYHIFAPIRFFEFMLGMLLARLFQIRAPITFETPCLSNQPFINDIYIVATLGAIFGNLLLRSVTPYFLDLLSYHLIMPMLYCVLLYRFARGNGMFARLFALPVIRQLGKASFYPYLLHIPLISWICWTAEHYFNYYKILHSPLNIATFVIVLYVGSLGYMKYFGKRKPAQFR